MRFSAYDTAVLTAELFRRAGLNRARVSEATIRRLSARRRLRSAFVFALAEALNVDFDLALVELASGGFALMPFRPLEGAKPITAKGLFKQEELQAIKDGTIRLRGFRKRIVAELDREGPESARQAS